MKRYAAALLLCASCGGRTLWPGDPALFGVDLVVTEDADAFAHAPDLPPRVRRISESVASTFGYDPLLLGGMRLVLTGEFRIMCGGSPAVGCFDQDADTVSVTTAGIACIEETGAAHELLHYFLWITTGDGDAQHASSQWMDLRNLTAALQRGGPGCFLFTG